MVEVETKREKKAARKSWRWWILLPFLLAVPFLTRDDYLIHIVNMIGIYTILSMGLNLLMGFTGQFSMGQAGFYAVGAYTSALLATKLGLPFWASLPLAGLSAGALGVAVGLVLRARAYVLALATIAFNEIVRIVILQWIPLTKGPSGVGDIPAPRIGNFIFNTDYRYYYLILAILLIHYVMVGRLIDSRIGRAMRALRDNELAAEAVGVYGLRYKVMAFAFAGFFSGLAGSLYAHLMGYVHPDSFHVTESFKLYIMVVVGGMGSMIGSLIGAGTMIAVSEYLRPLQEYNLLVYGLVLLLILIFAPEGLYGLVTRVRAGLARKS